MIQVDGWIHGTQENLHMYNESKLYKALTIFYFTDNTWHVIQTYT